MNSDVMTGTLDSFSPLALDTYGRRWSSVPTIYDRGWCLDPLPNLRVHVERVSCTDCDRFIRDGVEFIVVNNSLLGEVIYGNNRFYLVDAMDYVRGAVSKCLIVPSHQTLVGFAMTELGTYVPDRAVTSVTRPSVNRIDVPDSKLLYLESQVRTTFWLKPFYRARLSFHEWDFRKLFRPAPGTGYIDELGFQFLTQQRNQFLKDPFSDTMLRMTDSALVKFRTTQGLVKKVTVSDDMCRVTGLTFSFLAGTRPVTGRECSLAYVPRTYVPNKNLDHGCFDCYMLNPEVTFTQPPGDFPPTPDNGNVMSNVAKDGSMGFSPERGLWFEEPFERPEVMRVIGPAQISSTVVYDVRSTASATVAFTRLTTSRDGEHVYRSCQDLTLSVMFPDYDIEMAKKLGFLGKWGVVFNQIPRAMKKNQQCFILSHVTRDYAQLFSTFVREQCEEDGEYLGIRDLAVHESRKWYADMPMPKRMARLAAVACMEQQPNRFFGETFTPVAACVKDETGRVGKRPRQFISLGDIATMENPVLPRVVKHAMEHQFKFDFIECQYETENLNVLVSDYKIVHNENTDDNYSIEFVGASRPAALDATFNQICTLHTATEISNRVLFFDHSDDHGMHFHLNLTENGISRPCAISLDCDIAKCDLSHGPGIFYNFVKFCERLDLDALPLVSQLLHPILISHPDPLKRDSFLTVHLANAILFSGSTLTTVVNTWACHLLCLSYALSFHRIRDQQGLTLGRIVGMIKESAKLMGYEVTVAPTVTILGSIPQIPAFKFLMNFPVRVSGTERYVGIPCLGRLFRNLGWTRQEFSDPKSQYCNTVQGFLSSHTSAWHNLVSELVLGKPHLEVSLSQDDIVNGHLNVNKIVERESIELSDLAARYSYSVNDLMVETEFFFHTITPRLVYSPFVARVLQVDYGVE